MNQEEPVDPFGIEAGDIEEGDVEESDIEERAEASQPQAQPILPQPQVQPILPQPQVQPILPQPQHSHFQDADEYESAEFSLSYDDSGVSDESTSGAGASQPQEQPILPQPPARPIFPQPQHFRFQLQPKLPEPLFSMALPMVLPPQPSSPSREVPPMNLLNTSPFEYKLRPIGAPRRSRSASPTPFRPPCRNYKKLFVRQIPDDYELRPIGAPRRSHSCCPTPFDPHPNIVRQPLFPYNPPPISPSILAQFPPYQVPPFSPYRGPLPLLSKENPHVRPPNLSPSWETSLSREQPHIRGPELPPFGGPFLSTRARLPFRPAKPKISRAAQPSPPRRARPRAARPLPSRAAQPSPPRAAQPSPPRISPYRGPLAVLSKENPHVRPPYLSPFREQPHLMGPMLSPYGGPFLSTKAKGFVWPKPSPSTEAQPLPSRIPKLSSFGALKPSDLLRFVRPSPFKAMQPSPSRIPLPLRFTEVNFTSRQ
ncbi:hypothetical protein TNIN_381201 [Trichonephila inaurata madagascariensis]|uniref:Uncharacterized protein n=1 Tax=Trichonephila inaurata madagascariensis TaxID=2747483 RepID=A0A8X6YRQ4_9ARAC|nr:hypothetical protein TNIN_381201 [Trichonephila inaurata madagascariensis]